MESFSKSSYLIHWTGKDIDQKEDSERNHAYIKRFIDTLNTGLWMTKPIEMLVSKNNVFSYQLPTTCFTENLITRSSNHRINYGHLGFGFTRKWVLENSGNPVLYVRQNNEDRVLQTIGGILKRIDFCDSIYSILIQGESGAIVVKLRNELDEIRLLFQNICSIVKPMSNFNKDDFEYLVESEWRVIHNPYIEPKLQNGLIGNIPGINTNSSKQLNESWQTPKRIKKNEGNTPEFYLTFQPDDLEIVIFPNDIVRNKIWNSQEFKEWNLLRSKNLNMLTVEECMNF